MKCFLIDEDVPHSVARMLEGEGAMVLFVAEHLGCATDDALVAKYADDLGACIVTFNAKHFRKQAWRANTRLRNASCVYFECTKAHAKRRAEAAFHLLRSEVKDLSASCGDRRVFMAVRNQNVIVYR